MGNTDLTGYIKKVVKWAQERQLVSSETTAIRRQQLKLLEEIGELAEATNKLTDDTAGYYRKFVDAVGDTAVVLIILAQQNNQQFVSNLDFSSLKIPQKLEKKEGGFTFKSLNSVKVLEICDCLYGVAERSYPLLSAGVFASLNDLNYIAHEIGTSLVFCLAEAYNTIKDRKGETINGVFIKDEDLKENRRVKNAG